MEEESSMNLLDRIKMILYNEIAYFAILGTALAIIIGLVHGHNSVEEILLRCVVGFIFGIVAGTISWCITRLRFRK